jgi:hypothetical protein
MREIRADLQQQQQMKRGTLGKNDSGTKNNLAKVKHDLRNLSEQFAGKFGNLAVIVQEYKLNAERKAESGINIEFVLKMTVVKERR